MLKNLCKRIGRALSVPAAASGRERRRPRRAVPQLDGLPGRVVPAVVSGGMLYIYGTEAADTVSVTYGPGSVRVTENGQSQLFSLAAVTANQLYFWGGGGNDTFVNSTGVRATAFGMGGNDVLLGGSGDDALYGGDGDDYLAGGDGNDWLMGENGNDVLLGQNGNDVLLGAFNGSTAEVSGVDALYGGDGDDYLAGGDGNDLIYAGAGNDIAYGGAGHDSLLGEAGNDALYGEAGNDVVYGGGGDDWVYGGANNDDVFGGNGHDRVFGGSGDDFLSGGYLNFDESRGVSLGDVSDGSFDEVWGEAGNDTIYLADKKFWGVWLDSVVDDQSPGDRVTYLGWTDFVASATTRWGHLYGT